MEQKAFVRVPSIWNLYTSKDLHDDSYAFYLGGGSLFPTINLKDFVRDPTKSGGFWKEEGLCERPEIEFLC